MIHRFLSKALVVCVFVSAACNTSKRMKHSPPFIDPRNNRQYAILDVGNTSWMQDPLQFSNDQVKPVIIGQAPHFYDKENAERACPDGWRLPAINDLVQWLKWLPGESTRFGKRVDSLTLAKNIHFSLNGLGMGATNPRAAGPGYMTGFWLAGDTTMQFFKDKPIETRSMGIHIYRAGRDSFNIETTYLENGREYLLHCVCVKERKE